MNTDQQRAAEQHLGEEIQAMIDAAATIACPCTESGTRHTGIASDADPDCEWCEATGRLTTPRIASMWYREGLRAALGDKDRADALARLTAAVRACEPLDVLAAAKALERIECNDLPVLEVQLGRYDDFERDPHAGTAPQPRARRASKKSLQKARAKAKHARKARRKGGR